MNAKRAKKLRKQAEAMTIGKAERAYVTIETQATDVAGSGLVAAVPLLKRGFVGKKKKRLEDVVFVHPETTRGVYKALKRGRL